MTTAATPNQALQRTAPAVTLAAPPPSPAQPSRQPPPSLSLGSLGRFTMHARTFTISVLALVLLLGCRDATTPSVATAPDFKFIDSYLAKMGQGGGSFSRFDDETQRFHAQLALALSQKDRRAPGRIVYFTVLQGIEGRGNIPYESVLGRASYALFVDEVPLIHIQPGAMLVYTEADVYFWWERHKGEYEGFPPYDSWRQREHVKKTVIPMYESLAKKKPAA